MMTYPKRIKRHTKTPLRMKMVNFRSESAPLH